ncbi:hypothetical protein CWATWH0401_4452 [Crocosphaera watsonii WH 0401]|uniref:Uncharacterized protein n=2 Tax=Crocosphaera watsonii TaxID=263511 RepID=T2IZ25_CROWT|nr:hypothetical protein CWATWH0005_1798 [Crocosphaera watsonii WH 0005]CCQ61010.1 hypothetical protein CWATWH0401_4452 [Crocosphaera watsonii WH 0401]
MDLFIDFLDNPNAPTTSNPQFNSTRKFSFYQSIEENYLQKSPPNKFPKKH